MSKDKKGKQSPGKDDKVVDLKPGDASHAGGNPSAAPGEGEPSRPQTIEEVGLKLAQDIVAKALEGAKDDEVIAKLLTTSIERHCINQVLMQEVLQHATTCQVHAQRAEGMAAFIMRRSGTPVQLPPEKGEKKGAIVFKTWYEEYSNGVVRYDMISVTVGEPIDLDMVQGKDGNVAELRLLARKEGVLEKFQGVISGMVEPFDVHRAEIGIVPR